MRPRIRLGLLLALVALTQSACGTDSDDAWSAEPTLPRYLLEQVEQAEGLAAEILADDIVTPAEFEQALMASVACAADRGVEVRELEIKWTGPIWEVGWRIGPYGSFAADSAASDTFAQCRREAGWELVSEVYSHQNQMSEAEYDALFQRIAACLRDRGIPLRFDTPEAIFAATEHTEGAMAYAECYEASVQP